MAPGGTIALTVVDETTLLSAGAASTQILPDMRELDGWVYSSEPLWVQVGDAGAHRPPPARAGLARAARWSARCMTTSSTASAPTASSCEAEEAGLAPRRQAPDQLRAERGGLHRRPARGARVSGSGLRLLALYPEQMNIYADRGNILFLQRRCEWRGIPFEYAAAGPGDGFDPAGARPDLHRRRAGPRPGDRRRGHAADEARRDRRGRRGRAPPCSRSAAATSCSATATSSATDRSRASASPISRRCASPVRA